MSCKYVIQDLMINCGPKILTGTIRIAQMTYSTHSFVYITMLELNKSCRNGCNVTLLIRKCNATSTCKDKQIVNSCSSLSFRPLIWFSFPLSFYSNIQIDSFLQNIIVTLHLLDTSAPDLYQSRRSKHLHTIGP